MFLKDAPAADDARSWLDESAAADGYLANHTRLWAWRPDMDRDFLGLRERLLATTSLNGRERALIVSAAVSELGDSYCSIAWGTKLASLTSDRDAALVIADRDPESLTTREKALTKWVRVTVRDPNSTTKADVEELRSAGLNDREIFEATLLAAYRLAFSTVNDALGCTPDRELYDAAPPELRSAVTFGRGVHP
ncbi:MAG TPA: hypothetical protein VFO25_13650 [Candidatus Eremiobacteraceae bacterium]|nr:hypothetical protein [Candidatus Eremiobacteraceae bacterium]